MSSVSVLPIAKHRRRKELSGMVAKEIALAKERFLAPGETGRALYSILAFVQCNSRESVRQGTLQCALDAIEQWLNELVSEVRNLPEQKLRANIGRCEHVINWAAKFQDSKSSLVRCFAIDTQNFARRVLRALSDRLQDLEKISAERMDSKPREMNLFDLLEEKVPV